MTTLLTADEIAADLRCSPRKVREEARRIKVGLNLRGRAGYRFTQADREAILAAMRPEPTPARRRRRRAA